jgi:acyl carrier protein
VRTASTPSSWSWPFEEEFGVEIPDDAAETIVTVGDAVKFLSKSA